MSADGSSDVWAVGNSFASNSYRTLGERWDGTKWTIVSTPNARTNNWLNGVAALSAANVWAVGFSNDSTWAQNRTLAEHWDGTKWTVIATPNPTSGENDLWGVAAVSENDVWAVGDVSTSTGGLKTLIEHWNGTAWSVVSTPNLTPYNALRAVSASSTGDVWAVGNAYDAQTDTWKTLTEHWDGTRWKIVSSPSQGADDYLRAVSARASNDVWFVGEADDPAPNYTPHPLVEHWNGSTWSIVSSRQGAYTLYGTVALTATDAWIVGDANQGAQTLGEHWTGTSWSVVATPNVAGSSENALDAVAATGTTLWAVGASGGKTLVLRATGA